ncbi:uncharacterized protein LOC129740109 [Uranotaenia lowii]|uniref:uncharacterized protein LOC129740109 n=1 Tax=Uranotaenia lowii TaxID=190385 RepID=UPI0024783D06|nr:uncharacterized protein LOC129740109 [Uranotaenia lowii]
MNLGRRPASGHQWLATICVGCLLLAASAIPQVQCKSTDESSRISTNASIHQTTDPNGTLHESVNFINSSSSKSSSGELEEFEFLLESYVNDALDRNYYEIVDSLTDRNRSNTGSQSKAHGARTKGDDGWGLSAFDRRILGGVGQYIDERVFGKQGITARAVQTGRLFFFKGLKKILWPLMIGVQIVKTVILVLFLPSIIGSFGKILGKGLSSVSGLSHPADPTTVEDLDFKDNSYNSDQDFQMDMQHNSYLPAIDATPAGTSYNPMYDIGTRNSALSRLGVGGGRVTYVNSINDYNRQQKRNDFKIFHDIPSSSLLLTNYDPFYSPLLSRLDAVFAQMGLSNKQETCRERLVCLMYANPAKYAPYSNLISAQLSRELNELRKPTNDNPDILRFFKYMRAAKDGQDGIDCERAHKACTGYQDLSNPAMVTTFNDINKLVQARKL